MAANTSALFALTPVVGIATISVANTGRDGTGTIVQVAAGGTNGTRVEYVAIVATSTTTAGFVDLFLDPNTGTYHFWKSVAVTAATPSSTVDAFQGEAVRTDGLPLLVLPASYKLGAAPTKGENFRVIAFGGDF